MIDKLYFAKLTLSEKLQTTYSVKEYKVRKVTDSRIYFYKIFDEESNEDDVSYISLNDMGICNINHYQNGLIEIYTWCEEGYLEIAQERLKKNLQLNLEARIRKIYTETKEVFRSTIKIK